MNNPFIRASIRVKIFGIVASLLGLLGGVACSSHQRLSRIQADIHNLAEYVFPITDIMGEVNVHTLEQQVQFEHILKLYAIDPPATEQIQPEHQQFQAQSNQLEQFIVEAISLAQQAVAHVAATDTDEPTFSQLQTRLQHVQRQYQHIQELALEILQNLPSRSQAGASRALASQLAAQADLNQELESILIELEQLTLQTAQLSKEHQQVALQNSVFITGIAIILGLVYASAVTLGIVHPVRYLTQQVQHIHTGTLQNPLMVKSRDEVGRLSTTFNHLLQEIQQKEHLKEIFGKYVDPRIVAQLEDTGKALLTTGEKQVVTVLMSDIEGIRTMTQTLSPESLVDVINQYLSLLAPCISERQGFVEFVDTVIKGFWSPPFISPAEHAQLACEAALAQVSKSNSLRQLLSQVSVSSADSSMINLRIGLATGPLILGNIGPTWAMNYTVIGDIVNTAARLKRVAKHYGVQIILTEATQQQVEQTMITRELGLVQVVGKDEILRVYELLAPKADSHPKLTQLCQTFAQGLMAYRQQHWLQAQTHFAKCLQLQPNDGPAQNYLQWIQAQRDQPLPADWQGIQKLTQK
ncbi:MAG: adenylate/guanylate cyclase domain-containing protein [Cyanothece sp. SIO1E1]|nr:adenylate/guanylate cyclase domain-containing protein [Cyanothece sp. SIO1E1]